MTLPLSFPLSMSQIAAELGRSLPLAILDPWVLSLAAKSGPPIGFGDLLGKTGRYDGSNFVNSGPTFAISLNNSFFGGTIISASQTGSGNLNLVFSVAPNWSGNILFKNNTMNASAVLAKQNSTTWSLSGASGNILANRGGNTDSFTILPSS